MSKKYIAPQFDLPGCADIFSLAGEVAVQVTPAPRATNNNRTPELLFVDRVELRRLQKITRSEFKNFSL